MKMRIYTLLAVLMAGISMVAGQPSGVRTYDFRDGALIAAGKSEDGTLTLSGGSYQLHGATYGLNMKAGGVITIAVTGSSTVRFLGSKHSGLNVTGTALAEGDLGTQPAKVVNDLSDTYDFVYSGPARILTFRTVAGTGNDLYLPSLAVIPSQKGADASAAGKNIVYYFDLRDGSIIPDETGFNGNYTIEKGLFKVECGPSNAYKYNGADHGSVFKTGNRITLQVAGNTTVKTGGCRYSNGTVTVSSATGRFDKTSLSTQTATCYHEDGASFGFLYAGTAGTIVMEFTGTTYIPYIELIPVPYAVELDPWVAKAGTLTLNGQVINLASGASPAEKPAVTVSEGGVLLITEEMAWVRLNLGGKQLAAYTPSFTGDIASVAVHGDTLLVTYSGEGSKPLGYRIKVTDNSLSAKPEAGKTYSYNFADGTVFPQVSYSSVRYGEFFTDDGLVTLKSNTENQAGKFGYHDAQHGAVFFPGNSLELQVAGDATVTFGTCQYGSATDAVFEFSGGQGGLLGSVPAHNIGAGACGTSSFSYKGAAGVLTATLKSASFPTAEVYIHGLTVENAPAPVVSNAKTDVWDFGGEQLDTTLFNNRLTVDIINAWYAASVTPGSSGNVLPSFTAGVLSWVGGSNDRLRTTNTAITRYDQNIAGATGFTGRIYVNSAAAAGRFLSLALGEDDEVSLVTRTDAGGTINFQYVADPAAQTDRVAVTDLTTLQFTARAAGVYHIFDTQGKPSYFRVYRKDATYATLTGSVDLSEAPGIPANWALVFTNKAGKSWKATMTPAGFSVQLPAEYSYSLSLSDASGYILSGVDTLTVGKNPEPFPVAIRKIDLFTLSGAVTGLGEQLAKLTLVFTPDSAAGKIYQPAPEINGTAGTYAVMLEPGCRYAISALGVNDYYPVPDTIILGNADATVSIDFISKTRYPVSIHASGLTAEQQAALGLTFTNLYESGYAYGFEAGAGITLRDGTYRITVHGLDAWPVEAALTSNLTVSGAAVSKTLAFKPVTLWSFDDKPIPSGTETYRGLLFTGAISNEVAKGHLTAKSGSTIRIPVQPATRIRIAYYYSADFTIGGGTAYTTSSGSTNVFEYASYAYPEAEPGYVTVAVGSGAGTTYITEISLSPVVAFKPVVYVGADKEYKTIGEALAAVGAMDRSNGERVTVVIDPGNYEEMLVITVPDVTLKNGAALPSIGLINKGVDIAPGAVRITSYYGHGYSYYSMGADQKWNGELLQVNRENGYLSYENKGSGTTNGSYWNATVVISANGFVAENIIFENSFNQYVSRKESEDVVVMWSSGGKGIRPVDRGNTAVQDRSFVERAAALSITNNSDKVLLNNCRVVGRQDSFYGGSGARVVVYKGEMMGAVDYLFGPMTAVFYKSGLVMNTSDVSSDAAYLTAAQQSSGRGYLMFECTVKSAVPGTETASAYLAKPGYFGRPWQATTSEVVFFNTTVETSDYPGYAGKSLISPVGWTNTLGGESRKMYEYGTVEKSGENNLASRASWSTVLTTPTLTDGTAITTFNFTKGNDGWDPIPGLVAADPSTGIFQPGRAANVEVFSSGSRIHISNVTAPIRVMVYNLQGSLVRSFETGADTAFHAAPGVWVVRVCSSGGLKSVKVVTR